MGSMDSEIVLDLFPWLKVYKDGTIERTAGVEVVPPGLDPQTHVFSKDVVIAPEPHVSARIYRPYFVTKGPKLPLVVYFHGGAFCVASPAFPNYHTSLNKLVAEAHVILLSVGYRLAPDAGANIAHHLALRIKDSDPGLNLKVLGIGMIHPYFWGTNPIGSEFTDGIRKELVDKWWLYVCPSDKGCDDPLINPFVDGSPDLAGLGCDRVLVIVAEKDILKDRGRFYYDKLVKSEWKGKAEIMENEGEDHVFHIFNPESDKAKSLIKRLAAFLNQGMAVNVE
ncbi:hypothetical protein GQ457_01G026370 [Hibiscus cannabinus]